MTQLIITREGPAEPLCNTCQTADCEHLIEKTDVSIIGVNKEWRMMARGSDMGAVVECEGYSA